MSNPPNDQSSAFDVENPSVKRLATFSLRPTSVDTVFSHEKMAFPGVLLSPLPEHRRVAPFVPRPGDVLGCVLAFFFTAFFEGNGNERGIKCSFWSLCGISCWWLRYILV